MSQTVLLAWQHFQWGRTMEKPAVVADTQILREACYGDYPDYKGLFAEGKRKEIEQGVE
ncbi:hypothetical protein PHLCEN_2v11302 [Hermanssonia centrifuga]|uniref:Uncharacterized protein n=1 Tax=Hermanssonia centrifuga TaxID=98765 RepID=A0A2R6NK93_9APHY|nr:hypothetical protein PHLCEN_2v11302 [Hermanssonia centrifuga]